MKHFETFRGDDTRVDWASLRNDFFRIRKEKFVDDLGWELKTANGLERDQYDSDDTLYCLVHDNYQLMAGLRLLRTDRWDGQWSYMINDANRGAIPNLASGLLAKPPSSPQCYEISRLCASPSLPKRQQIYWLGQLAQFTFRKLIELGAHEGIAMIDPRFIGWLSARGFKAQAISRTEAFNGGRYAVLSGQLIAAEVAA